jgi:hypothetical protein
VIWTIQAPGRPVLCAMADGSPFAGGFAAAGSERGAGVAARLSAGGGKTLAAEACAVAEGDFSFSAGDVD